MSNYTREQLIEICEKAIVPVKQWNNRDSADAQRQIGQCLALLKAGCEIIDQINNNHETITVFISYPGFSKMDHNGPEDEESFYLPTPERLVKRKGGDWY
jgi:hypothetical protein